MHPFHVPDLKCGGCLGFVVRALRDINQAMRIKADVPTRTLRVISTRFEAVLLPALRVAGYPAESVLLPLG